LYHFDFYRFHDPKAWRDSGFREHFNERSFCLVEWPEKAGDLLPAPDLRITLALAPHGRDATLEAFTEPGNRCLKSIALEPSDSGTAPG
jgi:tRNA threonylcarbamoyladenosine biosynthesis protein TsaE